MTSATKVPSTASLRYAAALIDLAEENKSLDKIAKDLNELQSMISNSDDLNMLITSPLLSKAQQDKALAAIAKKAKFQKLTVNFIGVLTENGRLSILSDIINAFEAELATRRGEITVNATVAQDMSEKQKKALQTAISKSIGADVTVKTTVEPSILGGMIVTVGSQMIDDSVARKLERLKAAMGKQSNENLVNVKEA